MPLGVGVPRISASCLGFAQSESLQPGRAIHSYSSVLRKLRPCGVSAPIPHTAACVPATQPVLHAD